MSNTEVSLYIHVPFCKTFCHYCAFYKEIWTEEKENKYVEALLKEIHAYATYKPFNIPSIFFGGGTPSLLSEKSLSIIMKELKNAFILAKNCEITMEVNPESVTNKFCKTIVDQGINRLSMGVQSFIPEELKFLGRTHSVEITHQAIKAIRKKPELTLNLDLIFSIPNTTLSSVEYNLQTALNYEPEHLSTYALSIEPGTVFDRKKVRPLTSDTELEQYNLIKKTLEMNHYHHYEISAFAKDSFECIHNKRYWQYKPFIGLGPSGHSFFQNCRFENTSNLNHYIQHPTKQIESFPLTPLTETELIQEYIMSNFRLSTGLSLSGFYTQFGKHFEKLFETEIKTLNNLQLIKIDQNHVKTTEKGQALLNSVLEEFLK